MKALVHYTEFCSNAAFRHENSALYRIEIWGDVEVQPEAHEMTLDGSEPAVIEWGEVSKADPVQGSALTLRLISESDREYTHLYSTDTGTWQVRVLRNGQLYWCGTIDTELYTEPYATARGYEVEITASDFGVLDRLDFSGSGRVSIAGVIDQALTACCLDSLSIAGTWSTKYTATDTAAVDLAALWVQAANFYDEEGKPATIREALEAVLQPLGLRMVQRGGQIHIFDLNAAYSTWPQNEVYWTDVDAVLDTDVTYNRVVARLSAYSNSEGVSATLDHDDVLPDVTGVMYLQDTDWQNAPDGFRAAHGDQTFDNLTLLNGAKAFRIDAEYSGSDTAGFVWEYCGNLHHNYETTMIAGGATTQNSFPWLSFYPAWPAFVPIAKTSPMKTRISVGSAGGTAGVPVRPGSQWLLKVSLDLLLDARYNPFESVSLQNEEGDYGRMQKEGMIYIPVQIVLRNDAGVITHCFDNTGVVDSSTYDQSSAHWISATEATLNTCRCFLSWYDWDDSSKCGIGGWATNKQTIGSAGTARPRRWKARGDGYYIPTPPASGYIELWVGKGYATLDSRFFYGAARPAKLWRWLAYRNPAIEIVKANGRSAEGSDIEDSAWITAGAREELTIDLTVGTPGSRALPTARALLMRTDGTIVRTMCRAGVTDRLERLLIATVYSQYSRRRDILRGSVELMPALTTLTDAASPGKRYVMLAEVQKLAEEESEITMCEYGPDEWEGLEIETT